jgi:hypothetical protein
MNDEKRIKDFPNFEDSLNMKEYQLLRLFCNFVSRFSASKRGVRWVAVNYTKKSVSAKNPQW